MSFTWSRCIQRTDRQKDILLRRTIWCNSLHSSKWRNALTAFVSLHRVNAVTTFVQQQMLWQHLCAAFVSLLLTLSDKRHLGITLCTVFLILLLISCFRQKRNTKRKRGQLRHKTHAFVSSCLLFLSFTRSRLWFCQFLRSSLVLKKGSSSLRERKWK